jgi:hypothetical protein
MRERETVKGLTENKRKEEGGDVGEKKTLRCATFTVVRGERRDGLVAPSTAVPSWWRRMTTGFLAVLLA